MINKRFAVVIVVVVVCNHHHLARWSHSDFNIAIIGPTFRTTRNAHNPLFTRRKSNNARESTNTTNNFTSLSDRLVLAGLSLICEHTHERRVVFRWAGGGRVKTTWLFQTPTSFVRLPIPHWYLCEAPPWKNRDSWVSSPRWLWFVRVGVVAPSCV